MKIGDDIAAAMQDWKGLKVTCKLTIQVFILLRTFKEKSLNSISFLFFLLIL